MEEPYLNPYAHTTFFGFLWTLAVRCISYIFHPFEPHHLATDEIQVLVLSGVALSSAIVGTFLVLRKMSMLANAISHTILLGIVIAFLFTRAFNNASAETFTVDIVPLLCAAVITGVGTAYLTEFLTKRLRLQEDASTGLVFTTLFALGIILVTAWSRNTHIGAELVMGNADALHSQDISFVGWIFLFNFVTLIAFYKEFLITTFDPALARSLGYSVAFFNYLLMTQAAMTTIGAFRAIGVLLVLAFITGPVLTARLLTHELKQVIFYAAACGVLASVMGVALARHFLTVYGIAFSTSGIVVCTLLLLFIAALIFKSIQRRKIIDMPQAEMR